MLIETHGSGSVGNGDPDYVIGPSNPANEAREIGLVGPSIPGLGSADGKRAAIDSIDHSPAMLLIGKRNRGLPIR